MVAITQDWKQRVYIVCETCGLRNALAILSEEQISYLLDKHEGHKEFAVYDWDPEMSREVA